MLNGVSDVLTPWTAPRILQIMDGAAVSRKVRGDGSRGGVQADGAADIEGLLQLANQLPDVAGRVMAAPLFAQRPLVESQNGAAPLDQASSTSIIYEEARVMCAAALAVHRSTRGEEIPSDGRPSTGEQSPRVLRHSEAHTAAAELEEVGFAAEFSDPCIRGSFPDAIAALRHVLPEVEEDIPLTSHEATVQVKSQRGAPNLFLDILSFTVSPPSVSSATPPLKNVSLPHVISDSGSGASHRLHLVRPSRSAASAESQSLVLETIPPPTLIPIEAYGPPGHAVFDGSCVAYTFSADERKELLASLCTEPPPLQVFRKEAEVRDRSGNVTERETSASLFLGTEAAATATEKVTRGGSLFPTNQGPKDRCINSDDGWSVSSGWSSRSHSELPDMDHDKSKEEAPQEKEVADLANGEVKPPTLAATAAATDPTSGVISAARVPGSISTARTWIGDDDHLVLENGRITVQKRKVRPVKNLSNSHPLPKVVRAPLVDPSLLTTVVSTKPVDGEEEFTSVMSGDTGRSEATGDRNTSESAPGGKKRVAGAKHSRESTTGSAIVDQDNSKSPNPRKKITINTRAGVGCSDASVEASSEVVRVSTNINPGSDVRMSQGEMLEFVEGLRVSDTLRRALLIGVVTPAIPQAATVDTPEAAGEGQGESDEINEAR